MSRRPYIGLWLLLAVALAAVTWVAFFEDIHIGSYTVKKAPIAETIFETHDEASDTPVKTAEGDTVAPAQVKAELDTLPQVIFIFGDSMTFNLALRLAQYGKQNGHEVHAVNWDSSNTKIWADHDTLAYYINRFHPTQIFISLGSNELYLKKPDMRRPQVKRILDEIGDIPYVWIGPPNWKEDAGINDMIESMCRPGSFFRSAGMEFKRKKDGIHPTREASALWVDSIMRWLPKSTHPFRAETPADSIRKSNPDIILLKALNK
ncbi:MAG: hypothetical protein K2N88_09035 [Muribaculaceae bacterium]|nr:hypothetical protein [Muribaculaceae bacterium]